MRVLGLDISTVATGWAIVDNGKLLKYGVINPDADFNECEKYFFITHSIATIMKLYRPNHLAVEDTFMGKNVAVLKKLSRIAGQIMYLWYHSTRTEPYFYMASSARTSIPGLKGTADKEIVTEAVNGFFKLRKKIEDDNIADAVVTAYHHYVASQPEKPKEEPDVKKACKKRKRKTEDVKGSDSEA